MVPGHDVGKPTAPTSDATPHCSGCEVEHLGDLGVVEPGEISEYDRCLEFLGELRKRIVDIDAGGDGLAGIERRATAEGLICDTLVIREAGLRAATPPTELVEAGVGGDPVRPGRERSAAVEAFESLDDREQRLLGGVERVGVASGESATDRVDAGLMLLQKGIKGAAVSALRGGDQPEIVGIGCDAATLAVRLLRNRERVADDTRTTVGADHRPDDLRASVADVGNLADERNEVIDVGGFAVHDR